MIYLTTSWGDLYAQTHRCEKGNVHIVIWLFVYPVECTKGHITKVNIKHRDDIFSDYTAVADKCKVKRVKCHSYLEAIFHYV